MKPFVSCKFVIVFEGLNDGRVWVYTANRSLTPAEQTEIKSALDDFCNSWAAHGTKLAAKFDIFHSQILVLAVDENVEPASGCSIDKATGIFLEIDQKFNLDLLNRLNLAFLDEDEISLVRLNHLKSAFDSGKISENTVFIDNTISNLSALRTDWKKAFSKSWAFAKVAKRASTV